MAFFDQKGDGAFGQAEDDFASEGQAFAFDDVEEENNASKAWGAVVEISTGKILGWGQTPSFDPNVLDIED